MAYNTNVILENSADGYVVEIKDVKDLQTTLNGKVSNPMTTAGDLIVGGTNGTPTRLGRGSAGQVLTMNSQGTGQEWTTPASTGNLYRHHITLVKPNTTLAYIDLIISRSTKFANISELATYLNTQMHSANDRYICIATGYHIDGSASSTMKFIAYQVSRHYSGNANHSFVSFFNPDASNYQGASLEINSTNFPTFDDNVWNL